MKNKKERRITAIMNKYVFIPKFITSQSIVRDKVLSELLDKKTKYKITTFGVRMNKTEEKERLEVFNFFYKKGFDDENIASIWKSERRLRLKAKLLREEAMVRSHKVRKDNLNPKTNTINYGSGGGGSDSIRVPSKKRKNKWKNFLKLFPNYNKNK